MTLNILAMGIGYFVLLVLAILFVARIVVVGVYFSEDVFSLIRDAIIKKENKK